MPAASKMKHVGTMKHGATSFPMEILIDVITGVLNNDDKMMTYVFLDVIRSY